jgi:hypothetical protein
MRSRTIEGRAYGTSARTSGVKMRMQGGRGEGASEMMRLQIRLISSWPSLSLCFLDFEEMASPPRGPAAGTYVVVCRSKPSKQVCLIKKSRIKEAIQR